MKEIWRSTWKRERVTLKIYKASYKIENKLVQVLEMVKIGFSLEIFDIWARI